MGVRERQRAVRALRGQMWSPGRPSTARLEDRVRFWEAIARGASTDDAAAEAGVSSAVGTRWFRQAGGMSPISLAPASGRYLSFAEREEVAILHAQAVGVRDIARRLRRAPSTISRELRRNAATRGGRVEYRATTAQMARRAARQPSQDRQAGGQRGPARIRAGSSGRHDHPSRRCAGARARHSLDRPSPRPPSGSTLGHGVEP